MFALGGLDLLGAWLAVRTASAAGPREAGVVVRYGLAGAFVFVLLFVVYAASLRVAELAPVTFGWVVVLQLGVLVLARLDGARFRPSQLLAAGVLVAAEGYLILSSGAS